jgi:hypothetical protein
VKRASSIIALGLAVFAQAEPPDIEYVFPAGGQRGTTIQVRVGGYYFHGEAHFEMLGSGVKFKSSIKRTETVWFDGPMIQQPLSSRKEGYPKDHFGEITIHGDAQIGHRLWRCRTSQGVTRPLKFVIGDLPEITEVEVAGNPIPKEVALPVTINGRIFPREDVDLWTFEAKAGETIVCDAVAKRFGSPLAAVIFIRDSEGNSIQTEKVLKGGDSVYWFKVPKTGRVEAGIHDARFEGLQSHVYRLTIKRAPHLISVYPLGGRRGSSFQAELIGLGLKEEMADIRLTGDSKNLQTISIKSFGYATFAIGEHPEHLEPAKSPISVPAVLNGRILKPGETDKWSIAMKEKDAITLELSASTLGSPLDSVLEVLDEEGKQLSTNDDRAKGQLDSKLDFAAPKSGVYTLAVKDRFASRGGPSFAYRMTVTPLATQPSFSLTLADSHLNIVRSTEPITDETKPTGSKLRVTVDRKGGFKNEVFVSVDGLPPDVKVFNSTIASKKDFTDLQFTVPPKTRVGMHKLTVKGTGDVGDYNATRSAVVPEGLDHLICGIAPPVPFKHQGQYLFLTGTPSGSTYHRPYALDRGGFEGPLIARLADRQIRHLQGVTDRVLDIPPGKKDFKFPIALPCRIEIGRTSRVQVMLVGEITDFDKTRHTVSYTSGERDDQFICVPSAGLVSVETAADSFSVPSNEAFTIPVTIRRTTNILKLPMLVELIQPGHAKGILAEAVELAPGQEIVSLKVMTTESPGPLNAPFTIRARTIGPPRHVAEKKIEFVPPIK